MRADLNLLLGKQSALIRVLETHVLETWVHSHISSPAANGRLALADEILIKIIEAELQARHGASAGRGQDPAAATEKPCSAPKGSDTSAVAYEPNTP